MQDVPATPIATPYSPGTAPGSWKEFISSVGQLRFYQVVSEPECRTIEPQYETAFLHLPENYTSKVLCSEMAFFYSKPLEFDVKIRLRLELYRDNFWVGADEGTVTVAAGRGASSPELIRNPFGDVYDFTPGVYDVILYFDGERATNGRFTTAATVSGTTGCGPEGIRPCPTAAPVPRFFFFR